MIWITNKLKAMLEDLKIFNISRNECLGYFGFFATSGPPGRAKNGHCNYPAALFDSFALKSHIRDQEIVKDIFLGKSL